MPFFVRYPPTSGGGGGGTGTFTTEYRILTNTEVTNAQLILSNTPMSPTDIIVDPVSGSIQAYGSDFVVSGNTVSWSGLGMSNLGLQAGDELVISYSY